MLLDALGELRWVSVQHGLESFPAQLFDSQYLRVFVLRDQPVPSRSSVARPRIAWWRALARDVPMFPSGSTAAWCYLHLCIAAKASNRLLLYSDSYALLSIMKFVEQPDLPPWAGNIAVERDGDTLYVFGEDRIRHPQLADTQERTSWNILREYRVRPTLKGEQKQPAHIEFANALTDAALIKFVEHHGPVAGVDACRKPTTDNLDKICVVESLVGLRREQRLFIAALTLSQQLKNGDIPRIAELLSNLVDIANHPGPPWETIGNDLPVHPWTGLKVEARPGKVWFWKNRNQALYALQEFALQAGWHDECELGTFLRGVHSPVLRDLGRRALCVLLKAFPPSLEVYSTEIAELPVYEREGIRNVLYWMLRYDILRDHGIQFCANQKCGKFFRLERSGQRFCNAECSQHERQRLYWRVNGRRRREERIRRSKRGKGD